MKSIKLLSILSFLLLLSCIEVIDLDLNKGKERIVVDGNITNEDTVQFVRIFKTTAFKSTASYPPVQGALVYLEDRIGEQWILDDNRSDLPGYYFSQESFMVSPGDAFVLHIITSDGKHIVSSREVVQPVPPIFSANVSYIVNPLEEELDPELENYYLSALVNDEKGINNYYRWKIYVNGELRNLPSEITLFDDRIADGNLFRFDAGNVLFKANDSILVKHYSYSSNAYRYFQLLKQQTEHDELDNSYAKPSILNGNLTNINDSSELILGYFSAGEVQIVQDVNWPDIGNVPNSSIR